MGKKPGKSRISSVDQWRDRAISRVSYRTKRPRLAKSTRREVMKWNSRIVLRNEPIRGGKPVSSLQLYWLVQLVFSKLSPSGYTKKKWDLRRLVKSWDHEMVTSRKKRETRTQHSEDVTWITVNEDVSDNRRACNPATWSDQPMRSLIG